jgi:hypothetical protein
MASSFAEGTPSLKRLGIINVGEQAMGDFVVSQRPQSGRGQRRMPRRNRENSLPRQ